jgi:hypothetical protein
VKRSSLTPSKLRIVLVCLLLILLGASVGAFTVGYKFLADFSASSLSLATEAQASNSSLQTLISTKAELEKNTDIVDRASRIVAETRSYQYQDIANNILPAYAAQAGLTITSIGFANTQPGTTSAASTNPTVIAPKTPPGVKSQIITVAVKNPVDYRSMLNFIHYIEQSLFIMHIKQVTMSKVGDTRDGSQVSSDILTIEVYVR